MLVAGGGIFSTRNNVVGKKRPAAMRDGPGAGIDKLRAPADCQPGVASGPREIKRGRPRLEDRDKTLAATKPWAAAGMSERTWYRRQKERYAH